MLEQITTTIDRELCVGCGYCVQVCPARTLSLQDGKAVITGDHSLNCGHCESVCPTGAIKVGSIDEGMSQYTNLRFDQKWLPYGEFDTAQLVRLMASRRSCRNFLNKQVDLSILHDLVRIGCTAPSATNCQLWTFTILPNRAAVLALGNKVRDFYLKLNSMAEKKWLRLGLSLIGKTELQNYHQQYYSQVKQGLSEFEEMGIDRLFHGAPSVILIGSSPGATLPKEDAMLASQNILLAAHSMGLGTCLIGMAVEAMKNDRKIQASINIPHEESVYSIIAIGYSAEQYQRSAGRKKPVLRSFEP